MDSDDVWATLIDAAMARSVCAKAAGCYVTQVVHGTYVVYVHQFDQGLHVCDYCPPDQLPAHVVSRDSWAGLRRDALIARISRFLDHCHTTDQGAAESGRSCAGQLADRLGLTDTPATAACSRAVVAS